MCVCDTDRESVGCLLGVRGPKQNLKQDFFLSKFIHIISYIITLSCHKSTCERSQQQNFNQSKKFNQQVFILTVYICQLKREKPKSFCEAWYQLCWCSNSSSLVHACVGYISLRPGASELQVNFPQLHLSPLGT